MGNFCVKRVMVKADIPPSIGEETICRVLRKAGLKCTHVQRKEILAKNDLCNVQCATMKYEIIRKPVVLERVKLIHLNLHITGSRI